ncbi:Fic family protein [Halomonas sp. Mc5H-6]
MLNPLPDTGLIEKTQVDSPRSATQKYRLTVLGQQVLATKDTY